jgi:PTS system fructose-specific IIC component
MSDMITADLVDLDLAAGTKEEAARSLAERLVRLGRVTDLNGFLADVAAREAQMPTGLDGGIGIPHCRSAHVTEPTLAFGRSGPGIDFGAPDGPADLIFLIAAPSGADDAHLTILSSLARRLMDPAFTSALRTTTSPAGAATWSRSPRRPRRPGREAPRRRPPERAPQRAPTRRRPVRRRRPNRWRRPSRPSRSVRPPVPVPAPAPAYGRVPGGRKGTPGTGRRRRSAWSP